MLLNTHDLIMIPPSLLLLYLVLFHLCCLVTSMIVLLTLDMSASQIGVNLPVLDNSNSLKYVQLAMLSLSQSIAVSPVPRYLNPRSLILGRTNPSGPIDACFRCPVRSPRPRPFRNEDWPHRGRHPDPLRLQQEEGRQARKEALSLHIVVETLLSIEIYFPR